MIDAWAEGRNKTERSKKSCGTKSNKIFMEGLTIRAHQIEKSFKN